MKKGFTPTPKTLLTKRQDNRLDNWKYIPKSQMKRPLVRGFTLIELLIYMGLLVVALGLSSSLLYKISSTDLESSARIEIEESSRLIISHLKLEIEKARDSTLPLTDGETASVLTLIQPDDEDVDLDDEIVTFRLIDSDFYREQDGNSERLNSNLVKIDNFSVEKLGDPAIPGDSAIRISFRISPKETTLARLAQTFETSFNLNL